MTLERRYRRLVRAFPAAWRRRHEEDLVTTLLAGSRPGQRRPSTGDTIDLIATGLGVRMLAAGPFLLIAVASTVLVVTVFAVDAAVTPTPWAFLATSLLVVLAPGTGVAYAASTALSRGWRQGSLAAVGCTFGIVPHLLAAVAGLSGLMQASAELYEVVRWAGVAYLVYLGVGMLRSSGQISAGGPAQVAAGAGAVVRRGVLINVLNPKLTIFFLAFLPQFLSTPPTIGDARLIGLSVVFMAMTLPVFLGYAALAVQVRERVFAAPRRVRRVEQTFGLVLIGFAARLAVAER